MKKLIVAFVVLLVVTITFATPVFADNPPDNKPGGRNNPGLWSAYYSIPGTGYSYFAMAIIVWLLYMGTPPNWWK